MDYTQLATATTTMLWPLLPHLNNFGSKVAEGAMQQAGADAWERTKSLWAILQPKIQAAPGAQLTLDRAVTRPDDVRIKGAFEFELEELFKADNTLAAAISACCKHGL